MTLILAPMVRGSFPAMRTYCLTHQADFVYTDVIMAKALLTSTKTESPTSIEFTRTNQRVLLLNKSESPKTIVQLAGTTFQELHDAAELVKSHCLRLDLNLGCAKHFTSQCGAGGVLGASGTLAAELLTELTKTQNWSVKTRLRDEPEEALQHVLDLLNSGVKFVAIHSRKFDENREKTAARWSEFIDLYAKLDEKQREKIIFNGGIITFQDYMRFKKEVENAGLLMVPVMLARGAVRDPELFRQIKERKVELQVNSYEIYAEIGRIAEREGYKFCDYKACVMFGLKWVKDLSEGGGQEVRKEAIISIQTIAHFGKYEEIIGFLEARIGRSEEKKVDQK